MRAFLALGSNVGDREQHLRTAVAAMPDVVAVGLDTPGPASSTGVLSARGSTNFVHAEWITLHDNPGFRGFVDFLRAELDRIGPAQEDLCRDFFQRAVALELSFFEAAYPDRT